FIERRLRFRLFVAKDCQRSAYDLSERCVLAKPTRAKLRFESFECVGEAIGVDLRFARLRQNRFQSRFGGVERPPLG
ncbi:hypothetical protein ABTE87_22655, partial [Acinetobacter baumannii]